jgi:hypothetical protein
VRFVTAFSTTQDEIDAFAALGRGLARQAA